MRILEEKSNQGERRNKQTMEKLARKCKRNTLACERISAFFDNRDRRVLFTEGYLLVYRMRFSKLVLTTGDEETITQPGLEESVFGGFVDVDMAGQDKLDVARIQQKDRELRSDPYLDYLAVFEGRLVHITKYGYNRSRKLGVLD